MATVELTKDNFENVIGSSTAANSLTGNTANNLLVGGNQIDDIDGGLGDDNIFGGGSNDVNLTGGMGDDIIFGGWGSDWLHGGSGDDAISGAEALNDAYVPTYDINGVANGRLDLGYDSVGIASALVINPTTQNPGNVLFFHATYVAPKWSNRLSRRYTIGNHIFYALDH